MTVSFPGPLGFEGVGDYLWRASAFYSKWLEDPSDELVFAPAPRGSKMPILHWPGITYAAYHPAEDHPCWTFLDYCNHLKLEGSARRLYYFPTCQEREVAELYWAQRPGRRVFVQLRGGMEVKRYSHWGQVLLPLSEKKLNIVTQNTIDFDLPETVRSLRGWTLRSVLAIVATADLFIGFDSGPLWAALGSRVKSVALFPVGDPTILCGPVGTPYCALACENIPDSVPPEDIVKEALAFL